jgi:hypothetical protein
MADAPQSRPHAPRRRPLRFYEVLIGGCVVLISVVSLVVAISANRTQERMLAASVWPSLVFSTSNVSPEDGMPQIALDLVNRGTGPARVRWAELRFQDQPVAGPEDLMRRCCGGMPDGHDADGWPIVTSGLQRRVLGAEEWLSFFRMPLSRVDQARFDALEESRHELRLRVCYCSVLDDCWLLEGGSDDPEPVRQCPAAPTVLWRG